MISVILPIYNADKFLDEAIKSILSQTFTDFELICINDGSTDNSKDILDFYSSNDSRLKVVSRENRGLIYSLNEGIKLAKYDYIARMDADDICHPQRFEMQIKYLIKNKTVAVVGSAYECIDVKGKTISIRTPPTSNYMIKVIMGFGSPFAHPSVMMNKKLIKNDLYYSDCEACEDFELWVRLSKKHKLSNMKKVLLYYRIVDSSISRVQHDTQRENMVKIMSKYVYNINENTVCKFIFNADILAFLKCICGSYDKYTIPFRVLYFIRKLIK